MADRRELFRENVEWAASLALRVAKKRFPAWVVSTEDAEQAGRIGLWNATLLWNGGDRSRFRGYASKRVVGELFDQLRAEVFHVRVFDEDYSKVPGFVFLDAPIEGVENMTFADVIGDTKPNVEDAAVERELKAEALGKLRMTLKRRWHLLSPREQRWFALYLGEHNLREIGELDGVSESRVCQVLGPAIGRLSEDVR